jgi:hypothetical protein
MFYMIAAWEHLVKSPTSAVARIRPSPQPFKERRFIPAINEQGFLARILVNGSIVVLSS